LGVDPDFVPSPETLGQYCAPTPQDVIEVAMEQQGRPYVWGKASPEAGFDCSGLVVYSFKTVGVQIQHRRSQEQWTSDQGVRITRWSALRPGDAIYFHVPDREEGANHVGLYLGNGKMIVAPSKGKNVEVQNLGPYWRSSFVGAKRYISNRPRWRVGRWMPRRARGH
jgi:murein DD-endopeptidase